MSGVTCLLQLATNWITNQLQTFCKLCAMNNRARQRVAKRLAQWAFTTITGLNLGVMVHRIHMINNTTGSMIMMSLGTLVTGARATPTLHNGQMMLRTPWTQVHLVWMPLQMTMNFRKLFKPNVLPKRCLMRLTATLTRDRGFGQFSSAGKGKGKCFQCGGDHFARDCPDRLHPRARKGFGKQLSPAEFSSSRAKDVDKGNQKVFMQFHGMIAGFHLIYGLWF